MTGHISDGRQMVVNAWYEFTTEKRQIVWTRLELIKKQKSSWGSSLVEEGNYVLWCYLYHTDYKKEVIWNDLEELLRISEWLNHIHATVKREKYIDINN